MRVHPSLYSRVSSQLIGGISGRSAPPTERKSRIRNNEPREPRGLTRAVKPLWLYSAAPFSPFIRIGNSSSPLSPSTLLVLLGPRRYLCSSSFSSDVLLSFSFSTNANNRDAYYSTRCRDCVRSANDADGPKLTFARLSDDNGDEKTEGGFGIGGEVYFVEAVNTIRECRFFCY